MVGFRKVQASSYSWSLSLARLVIQSSSIILCFKLIASRQQLGYPLLFETALTVLAGLGTRFLKRRESLKEIGIDAILSCLFFVALSSALTVVILEDLPPQTDIHHRPDLTWVYKGIHYITAFLMCLFVRQDSTWLAQGGLLLFIAYSSVIYERLATTLRAAIWPSGNYNIAYALVLLTLTYYFSHPQKRPLHLRSPDYFALLLIGIGILSVFGSVCIWSSLQRTIPLVSCVLIYALIVQWADHRFNRWILAVIALRGAIVAALIIWKEFLVFQHLGFSGIMRYRVVVSEISPNQLGLEIETGMLALLGVLSVWPVSRAKRTLVGAGLTLLFLVAIYFTYSGANISGLMAGVGLYLLFFVKDVWKVLRSHISLKIVALVGAMILTLLAITTIPSFVVKIWKDFSDPQSGLSFRKLIWNLGYRAAVQMPVWGTGLGNYYVRAHYVGPFPYREVTRVEEWYRLYDMKPEGAWREAISRWHPHNSILEIWAGMGIIGVVAALGLCLSVVRNVIKGFPLEADKKRLLVSALACMIAIFVSSLTILGYDVFLFASSNFWFVMGVAVSTARVKQHPKTQTSSNMVLLSPRHQHILISFCLVFLLLQCVTRPVLGALAWKRVKTATNDEQRVMALLSVVLVDPFNDEAFLELGDMYLATHRLESAEESYRQACRLREYYAPCLTRLGWVKWYQGDLVAAERYFREAISADPWEVQSGQSYQSLGWLYLYQGREEQAAQLFRQAIIFTPYFVQDTCWQTRPDTNGGKFLRLSNLAVCARKSQVRGLRRLVLPENVNQVETGSVSLNSILKALYQDYQQVLHRRPDTAKGMLIQLADTYRLAGNQAEFLRLMEEVKRMDPADPLPYYEMGKVLLEQGRAAEALDQFLQAIMTGEASHFEQRVVLSYYEAGKIYYLQGNYDLALEYLQLASQKHRSVRLPVDYSLTLSAVYQHLGDPHRAIRVLERQTFIQETRLVWYQLADLYGHTGSYEKQEKALTRAALLRQP